MRIISEAIGTCEDLRRELQRRRQSLGVTAREFDDATGLPTGYMSKLECGMRSLGGNQPADRAERPGPSSGACRSP